MNNINKDIKKNSSNKTEYVYQKLLHDIIMGKLYQGQRLIEQDLIDIYKVSKTPLREALIELEKNGIVQRKINCGFEVKRILLEDVNEIYDLREIIEGLSARIATKNITQEKTKKIENIISDMAGCIKNNKIREYIKYDKYFHFILIEFSDNKRLKEIYNNLSLQIQMLLTTSIKLPERGINVSFKEHKDITNAILIKNPDQAEAKARMHILKTKKAVLKYFCNSDN